MFFFKQKTAYELRISDWSSDVCSSDLSCGGHDQTRRRRPFHPGAVLRAHSPQIPRAEHHLEPAESCHAHGWTEGGAVARQDRKSVVSGKSVSVRVDLGGRRIIKKTTTQHNNSEIQIKYYKNT